MRLSKRDRLVAFFITFFFAFTNLIPPGFSSVLFDNISVPGLELNLPAELGRIEESYLPPSSVSAPFIFHIQTAHGDVGIQKKVKEILRFLHDTHKISLVFAEGASEKLNPELLRFFDDPSMNQKMTDRLLEKGLYTGVDLFLSDVIASEAKQSPGLLRPAFGRPRNDVEVLGIEAASIYRAAYEAFKKVLRSSETVKTILTPLELELDRQASRVLSKEELLLLKNWQKFQKREMTFLAYINFIRDAAQKDLKLDFEDPFLQLEWPQLVRLARLQEFQKNLDREKLQKEKEKLGAPLPDDEIEQDPRRFFEHFLEKASRKGFRFEDYPHFTRWMAVQILAHELDGRLLSLELEKLWNQITGQIKDEKAREIIRRHEELSLLKKLLSLELTRSEWEEIRKNPTLLKLPADLRPFLNSANRFYRIVKHRENIFFEKLSREMKSRGADKAILVTGGFHTSGLTQFFKEKGLGYAVISPRVEGEVSRELYRDTMLKDSHLEIKEVPQTFWAKDAQVGRRRVQIEIQTVKEAFQEIKAIKPMSAWDHTPYAKALLEWGQKQPSRAEVRSKTDSDFERSQKEAVIALYEIEDQGHLRLFEPIAVALAEKMGLTAEKIRDVRGASLLHEAGRIGINYKLRNEFVDFARKYDVPVSRGEMAEGGKFRGTAQEFMDSIKKIIRSKRGQLQKGADRRIFEEFEKERKILSILANGSLSKSLRETLARFMTHDEITLQVTDELLLGNKIPFPVTEKMRQILRARADLEKTGSISVSGSILRAALILLVTDQIALTNEEERRQRTRFKDWTQLSFVEGFRNTLDEIDQFGVDRYQDQPHILKAAYEVRNAAWGLLLQLPDNKELLPAILSARKAASIEPLEWVALKMKIRQRRRQLSRAEVRSETDLFLEKLNGWGAEDLFNEIRRAHETGVWRHVSKYPEWAGLETQEPKIRGAGVLVLRKIGGEWAVLLGRQTQGRQKGKYVAPSGRINRPTDPRFEKAAEIEELIRLGIAGENDRQPGSESVPAGALRELFEETRIEGRIAGRLAERFNAEERLLMTYFIHIDTGSAESILEADGELQDFRWIPLRVIFEAEEGKAGDAVADYLKSDLAPALRGNAFNLFRTLLTNLARSKVRVEPSFKENEIGIIFSNPAGIGLEFPKLARQLYGASASARALYTHVAQSSGLSIEELFLADFNRDKNDAQKLYFATFAYTLALYEALKERIGDFKPASLTGSSLGILAALVISKAVGLDDMIQYIKEAAKQVNEGQKKVDFALVQVYGTSMEQLKKFLDPERTQLFEDASPFQVILAVLLDTDLNALKTQLERQSRKVVVRRDLELKPPHHTFYPEAQEPVAQLVDRLNIRDPEIPIVSSADPEGGIVLTAEEIRRELRAAFFKPVYWAPVVATMRSQPGLQAFLEIGPGHILTTLTNGIVTDKKVMTMNEAGRVEGIARTISRAEVRRVGFSGGNAFRVDARSNPRTQPLQTLRQETPTLHKPSRDYSWAGKGISGSDGAFAVRERERRRPPRRERVEIGSPEPKPLYSSPLSSLIEGYTQRQRRATEKRVRIMTIAAVQWTAVKSLVAMNPAIRIEVKLANMLAAKRLLPAVQKLGFGVVVLSSMTNQFIIVLFKVNSKFYINYKSMRPSKTPRRHGLKFILPSRAEVREQKKKRDERSVNATDVYAVRFGGKTKRGSKEEGLGIQTGSTWPRQDLGDSFSPSFSPPKGEASQYKINATPGKERFPAKSLEAQKSFQNQSRRNNIGAVDQKFFPDVELFRIQHGMSSPLQWGASLVRRAPPVKIKNHIFIPHYSILNRSSLKSKARAEVRTPTERYAYTHHGSPERFPVILEQVLSQMGRKKSDIDTIHSSGLEGPILFNSPDTDLYFVKRGEVLTFEFYSSRRAEVRPNLIDSRTPPSLGQSGPRAEVRMNAKEAEKLVRPDETNPLTISSAIFYVNVPGTTGGKIIEAIELLTGNTGAPLRQVDINGIPVPYRLLGSTPLSQNQKIQVWFEPVSLTGQINNLLKLGNYEWAVRIFRDFSDQAKTRIDPTDTQDLNTFRQAFIILVQYFSRRQGDPKLKDSVSRFHKAVLEFMQVWPDSYFQHPLIKGNEKSKGLVIAVSQFAKTLRLLDLHRETVRIANLFHHKVGAEPNPFLFSNIIHAYDSLAERAAKEGRKSESLTEWLNNLKAVTAFLPVTQVDESLQKVLEKTGRVTVLRVIEIANNKKKPQRSREAELALYNFVKAAGQFRAIHKEVASPDATALAQAVNAVAWHWVDHDRFEVALVPATLAYDLDPESPYALAVLSAVAAEQGRISEAKEYLTTIEALRDRGALSKDFDTAKLERRIGIAENKAAHGRLETDRSDEFPASLTPAKETPAPLPTQPKARKEKKEEPVKETDWQEVARLLDQLVENHAKHRKGKIRDEQWAELQGGYQDQVVAFSLPEDLNTLFFSLLYEDSQNKDRIKGLEQQIRAQIPRSDVRMKMRDLFRPRMKHGIEALREADRILKKRNAVGIVIGSIGEYLWNRSFETSASFNSEDLDVAVLTPRFQLQKSFEGGIDWWLPVDRKITVPHGPALVQKVFTLFVNGNDIFIRSGIGTDLNRVLEFPPGLYLPPRQFLVDLTLHTALASFDPEMIRPGVPERFRARISRLVKKSVSPLWRKNFGAERVLEEVTLVQTEPWDRSTVQAILRQTRFQDRGIRNYEVLLAEEINRSNRRSELRAQKDVPETVFTETFARLSRAEVRPLPAKLRRLVGEIIGERKRIYNLTHGKWAPPTGKTKDITVLGSARTPEAHPDFEFNRRLGAAIGKAGFNLRDGAADRGVMEAVFQGFNESKKGKRRARPTRGIRIKVSFEQSASRYAEIVENFEHFATRKWGLFEFVFMTLFSRGGYGTLDEFFEALHWELPFLLLEPPGTKFWTRIVDTFNQSWKEGGFETHIPRKRILNDIDAAVQWLDREKERDFMSPFRLTREKLKQANGEFEEGVKELYRAGSFDKKVVVFAGEPRDEAHLDIAEALARKLDEQGAIVRVVSRGPLLERFLASYLQDGWKSIPQAVLFIPEGEEPTTGERVFKKFGKGLLLRDALNHKVLLGLGADQFVIFPGEKETMTITFDNLQLKQIRMQEGKGGQAPLLLFGRNFWGPIKEVLVKTMYENGDIPFIGAEDIDLFEVLDTLQELERHPNLRAERAEVRAGTVLDLKILRGALEMVERWQKEGPMRRYSIYAAEDFEAAHQIIERTGLVPAGSESAASKIAQKLRQGDLRTGSGGRDEQLIGEALQLLKNAIQQQTYEAEIRVPDLMQGGRPQQLKVNLPRAYAVYSNAIELEASLKDLVGVSRLSEFFETLLEQGYVLNTPNEMKEIKKKSGYLSPDQLYVYPAFDGVHRTVDWNTVFVQSPRYLPGAQREVVWTVEPVDIRSLGIQPPAPRSVDSVLPLDYQYEVMRNLATFRFFHRPAQEQKNTWEVFNYAERFRNKPRVAPPVADPKMADLFRFVNGYFAKPNPQSELIRLAKKIERGSLNPADAGDQILLEGARMILEAEFGNQFHRAEVRRDQPLARDSRESSTAVRRSSTPVSRVSTRSIRSERPWTSSAITDMSLRNDSTSVPTSVAENVRSSLRGPLDIVSSPREGTLPQGEGFVNIKNKYSKFIYQAKIREEIKRLSGEEIRPETAFELGKAVGAFNPKYSREVLLAMLRALRMSYRRISQELIPVYLREIMDSFRAKGISLERRKKEIGAEILMYDHVPTEPEMAALVFSLALNSTSGIPAEVIIFSEEALSAEALESLAQYETRLKGIKDIEGKTLEVNFFHHNQPRVIANHLQKISSQLVAKLAPRVAEQYGQTSIENRQAVRSHIVVTLNQDFARRLEREDPLLLYPLYGMKQVHYEAPKSPSYYSALQSAAVSLAQKDYEALGELDRLVLERHTPFLYTSRYDRIPENWHAAWLLAEAKISEMFRQAA